MLSAGLGCTVLAIKVHTTCIDLIEARPMLGTLQCLLLIFLFRQ